jgi:hypothetical protein
MLRDVDVEPPVKNPTIVLWCCCKTLVPSIEGRELCAACYLHATLQLIIEMVAARPDDFRAPLHHKKRRYGTGTVYQKRKNATWSIAWREEGQRRSQHGFSGKREASRALAALLHGSTSGDG